MSNGEPKLTRQEVFKRIRESSKEEFILQEMMRLDFWPEDKEKPTLAESLIQRRAEIQKELRQLGIEQQLIENPQKALQALHKQRKQEALQRREETRQRNNQLRYEKSKQWFELNQTTITYLGDGSENELRQTQCNPDRLRRFGLPEINSSQDLADKMGIQLHELRFLSYYRAISKKDHYQHFELVKKSGGIRTIAAPMPRLKRAQYWILDNILLLPKLSDSAHGFVCDRSIVSNARSHVNQAVVINLDLQDFFPSITRERVKGLFTQMGYSEQIAAILSNLCTVSKRALVELDGESYFVAVGDRCLPQGAPTSPAISNLICRKLDARMRGAAADLQVNYSRYADDLTFSFTVEKQETDVTLKKLLWRVRKIISDEGFVINEAKTRIMRASQRQEVTGVVVNRKLNVDRTTLKKFRALLFQIDKDGFAGKRWGSGGALLPSIEGYANFVAMVNPEKGIPLQKQVIHLKRKYNISVPFGRVLALNNRLLRAKAAKGEFPRTNWWVPALPQPPVLEKTQAQIQEEKTLQSVAVSLKMASNENVASPELQSPPIDMRKLEGEEANKRANETFKRYSFLLFILVILLLLRMLKH